jgi:peptidoglycan hydrolase-like protein with peptidoglycan-binding domain
MNGIRDRLRIQRPSCDLEIELFPSDSPAAARAASLRELRQLIFDSARREPNACRAVREIVTRLRGGHVAAPEAQHGDIGSTRAQAMSDEVLFAARAGWILARRLQPRSVGLTDASAGAVLAPASSTEHVYAVYVVDDTGAPVSDAALTLDIAGDKQDKTTDGSGKVTVQKTVSDTGTVTLTNLDELRDKLWSQWSKPLADKAPPGDQITRAIVTQRLAALAAPADWLVTIVLQRPPIWRVRMVGMIFDADKCFPLPQALDGIRSVVAMHQAHPEAKVLIVGHEGGDEVTGGVDLALGRAKMLSDYLTSTPDGWMSWFRSDKSRRQRWGTREVQLMLSALTGADGEPFYAGSSPGVMDEETAAALKAFQLANGLTPNGKAGAKTREALVRKYMALEDTSLAAGVEPVTHGCTGHEDDTLTEAGLEPDDRRLEVLFFDTEIRPPPSGDTSDGGSPEYPAWRARLVETVDFDGPRVTYTG